MSKNGKNFLVLVFTTAVLFTVLSFTIPFNINGVFFLAYFMGMFAICAQPVVFKVSDVDMSANKLFYGFPIIRNSFIYMAVQIIISFMEMALSSFLPVRILIIINAVFIAVMIYRFIPTLMVKQEISKQRDEAKEKKFSRNNLEIRVTMLRDMAKDAAIKKSLDKLAEMIRYSDPVSNEDTFEVENEINDRMDELEIIIAGGNYYGADGICTLLMSQIRKRNSILAASK